MNVIFIRVPRQKHISKVLKMYYENFKRLYLFIQIVSDKIVKKKIFPLISGTFSWNICRNITFYILGNSFEILIFKVNCSWGVSNNVKRYHSLHIFSNRMTISCWSAAQRCEWCRNEDANNPTVDINVTFWRNRHLYELGSNNIRRIRIIIRKSIIVAVLYEFHV